MGRCDRRCLALGIKRSLSKIDKIIVKEAMKIEVDALMYEFARLHGIGVIPDEISNSITLYIFLNDPESRIDTGFCMKLVFDNHCVKVNWDTVDSSYLERALKQVTIYLNLRYWEEYLEPDCVMPMHLPWNPLQSEKTHSDDALDAMRYMIPVIPKLGVAVNNGPTPKEEIDKVIDSAMRKTGLTPVVAGPYAAYCEVRKNMDADSMYPKFSDNILNYMKKDVESTMNLYKRLEEEKKNTIKKVIFHDPATIIYWEDGTKTVVKVKNGEKFDPEKGMAMAICKKTHGNDGGYYKAFKEFLPKEEKKTSVEFSFDLPEGVDEPTEDNIETPMDLEECMDTITIDTEAEQYTGEAPKEVSDNRMTINDALLSLMRDTGCLNVTFVPDSGRYCIEKRDCIEIIPYYVYVESPTEEISLERYTQLKLDILKHFGISDSVAIDTEAGETPKEVSDDGIGIDTALAAFVEDVGCLEALYDPKRGVYYVRNNNNFVKPPYELKVDSPIAEVSPTALSRLKLDICKYFDI